MTEGTSLDDLLNDVPEVVESTPETAAEPVRDESGRFAAKETGVQAAEPTGEAEPVPPTDQLPPETFKAVKEEREKRQNLEREVETLRLQIQQAQAQNQRPPEPPPSLWEDEEGARAYDRQVVLEQAAWRARIDASEMAARGQFPDFQEKFDLFNQMAAQNPQLVQQAMADPHPWAKAYQIAQSHKTMQELGAVDVPDLEAKIREKVMAEMQQGQTAVPQQNLPPSINGVTSVGARTGPAWSGPTPLADLLR